MIFVQNSSSKRSWSKNRPATTVHHGHPAKIPITQPLGFQALRTLLGQAPSSEREKLSFESPLDMLVLADTSPITYLFLIGQIGRSWLDSDAYSSRSTSGHVYGVENVTDLNRYPYPAAFYAYN